MNHVCHQTNTGVPLYLNDSLTDLTHLDYAIISNNTVSSVMSVGHCLAINTYTYNCSFE